MNTETSPKREIVAYIGVAYALALTIAITLPHANINLLLSVLVPTITVTILTFTVTPRGSRKAVWGRMGFKRASFKTWPAAIALPFVLCAGAYGVALVTGAGKLDVHLSDATPSWLADL